MVYIESWDDFMEKSVQLLRADPEKTRYVMKYRHCDGKLVLKVTDDKESCKAIHLPTAGVSQISSRQIKTCPRWFSESIIQYLNHPGKCIKFKTDQAQDAKKMEKFNNIFFTLMARGPEADISEVGGKEQMEAQPARKGRGRKQ